MEESGSEARFSSGRILPLKFPRRSGVLLHPTSLPGPFGCGDFGKNAYRFVDWLAESGQRLWQMLPLGPLGVGNSPYSCLSAYAGNFLMIDVDDLVEQGWVKPKDLRFLPSEKRADYSAAMSFRMEILRKAAKNFFLNKSGRNPFYRFCESEGFWLDDFALFMALHDRFEGALWCEWDSKYSHVQHAKTMKRGKELERALALHKFIQWQFHSQWSRLKEYAAKKNVALVGDLPIYVAHDSADVWSNPMYYFLDDRGYPTIVAGVPPDYYSKTGQRWGNPIYRWDLMRMDGYKWWKERFRHNFAIVDILRIDHFRGFAAFWEIPATEATGEHGRWMPGPGEDFFNAVQKELGEMQIIAEDLGIITPDVIALRDKYGFPGMKVLQFAFSEGFDHPFLPHNYPEHCVVYTGTHDNDTTQAWFSGLDNNTRRFVLEYVKTDGSEIHWDLIRLASESRADTVFLPLQDILGLGGEARMNFPGRIAGNWEWRFTWDMMRDDISIRLRDLTARTGRS